MPSAYANDYYWWKPIYPEYPEWNKDTDCNYYTTIGGIQCRVHYFTHRTHRYVESTKVPTGDISKQMWVNTDPNMLTYNTDMHSSIKNRAGWAPYVHGSYIDIDQQFLRDFLDHGMINILMMEYL